MLFHFGEDSRNDSVWPGLVVRQAYVGWSSIALVTTRNFGSSKCKHLDVDHFAGTVNLQRLSFAALNLSRVARARLCQRLAMKHAPRVPFHPLSAAALVAAS